METEPKTRTFDLMIFVVFSNLDDPVTLKAMRQRHLEAIPAHSTLWRHSRSSGMRDLGSFLTDPLSYLSLSPVYIF